jgi:hypothetical protein
MRRSALICSDRLTERAIGALDRRPEGGGSRPRELRIPYFLRFCLRSEMRATLSRWSGQGKGQIPGVSCQARYHDPMEVIADRCTRRQANGGTPGIGNWRGLRWQDVDCAPKTMCASARTAATRSAGRNRSPANARFIPAQIAAGVTVEGIRSGIFPTGCINRGKDGGLQWPGKVVQERMGRDRQQGIDTGTWVPP